MHGMMNLKFKNGLKTVVCLNLVTKHEISRKRCKLEVYGLLQKCNKTV